MRSRKLSWRSPLRNFFQTPSKTTAGADTLETLREFVLRPVKDQPGGGERRERYAGGYAESGGVVHRNAEQSGAVSVDDRSHRVESRDRGETTANGVHRIQHGREKHPGCQDQFEQVLDVAIEKVRDRQEQPNA